MGAASESEALAPSLEVEESSGVWHPVSATPRQKAARNARRLSRKGMARRREDRKRKEQDDHEINVRTTYLYIVSFL